MYSNLLIIFKEYIIKNTLSYGNCLFNENFAFLRENWCLVALPFTVSDPFNFELTIVFSFANKICKNHTNIKVLNLNFGKFIFQYKMRCRFQDFRKIKSFSKQNIQDKLVPFSRILIFAKFKFSQIPRIFHK